ncbi:MAG: hypothetical protein M1820_005071 [Bogoriella megaspora]|nr:MAG: hypothetical protein M1820_005071 [Bogoriella megaspora]
MSDAWRDIAKRKQDERDAKIPKEWQLSSESSPDQNTLLEIPRRCGILNQNELEITGQYDATALLEKLSRKELRSVDVVTAFCKRAAIAHQVTNCLTEIFFPQAIARAKALDAYIAKHAKPVGPLHGLPISLKDSFSIPGIDSSVGVTSLVFKPSSSPSNLVPILLNAGAVLYCKTNIPQTLMALDSMNHVFGRTINPSSPRLTPGGSTGGEGALIAMRGSVLGVGTDIGGSIRIPAMCNGLYGIKPSVGRVPYGGQESLTQEGSGRVGLQASAGPLATSLRDCEMFLNIIAEAQPWNSDIDCIPGPIYPSSNSNSSNSPLRIGIMHTDGTTNPLPPIASFLHSISNTLRASATSLFEVHDLPITLVTKPLQSLTNNLLYTDGGQYKFSKLSSTGEPTIPWVEQRMKPSPPKSLEQVRALHERREKAAADFLKVWSGEYGSSQSATSNEPQDWTTIGLENRAKSKPLDAIICPIAPHPVPEIERWNATGYTAMWVLLDYPAGFLPVRRFTYQDTLLEIPEGQKVIGSWDRVNRELWDRNKVDRNVYVGSCLGCQVVVPRLQEGKLCRVMGLLEEALKPLREEEGQRAKL